MSNITTVTPTTADFQYQSKEDMSIHSLANVAAEQLAEFMETITRKERNSAGSMASEISIPE